jgi:hypothetical protein
MNPLPLFVGQFLWFLVAWSALAAIVVAPRLRSQDADTRLIVWLTPQLFRVLGTGLLVERLAPGMPRAFALPTAIGDTLTAVLALTALAALHARSRHGRALAWTCTIVGSVDVTIALAHAAHVEAARYLAAQWYVAAVLVPLMIVSHVMTIRALRTVRH